MIFCKQWRGCLGFLMVAAFSLGGGQHLLAEESTFVSSEMKYMTDEERKAWLEGLTTQSIKKLPDQTQKEETANKDQEAGDKPVIKTARQELETGLDTHSKTQIQTCNADIHQSLKISPIEFLPGRATLTKQNMVVITKLADKLKDCATAHIIVEGHTDDRGNPATNQRLSGLRAEAVMKALIKLGIPAKRLRAVGYGAEKPIVSNDTVENRATNRRIEMTLY